MPLYEYYCKSCDETFEILQKISDKPLSKCPECGKKIEKQVSSSAFVLKGTGWYKTDYAQKPSDKKTKSETNKETKTPNPVDAGKTKTETTAKKE